MKFLLVYNMKIVIKWGDETLVRGNKNLVEGGSAGEDFSRWGEETSKFSVSWGGLPPFPL